jgi:hypothetical protein
MQGVLFFRSITLDLLIGEMAFAVVAFLFCSSKFIRISYTDCTRLSSLKVLRLYRQLPTLISTFTGELLKAINGVLFEIYRSRI